MTKILHKRGSGEPDAGSLDVGEIALDTSAGTAYTKLSNGTVVEIGGSGGGYDDTQIRDDLAQEIKDREEGDQALQDQIDSLGSGGGSGGGSSVGAMSEGSVVISAYTHGANKVVVSRAIDYSEIANPSAVGPVGTDGIQPPTAQNDHHRRTYGVVWSDYWKRYFTVGDPPAALSPTGTITMHLFSSADAVHWSDMGLVKDLVGWSGSGNSQPHSAWYLNKGQPILCVDDSNGRIWFAGRGQTSPYPLCLAYYDIERNIGAVVEGPLGSNRSANKASYVIDWKWIADLQQIIIFYANTTGRFCTAVIDGGSNTPVGVQDEDGNGGDIPTIDLRQEDNVRFFHAKSGGVHKFYAQGAGARMWFQEGDKFDKFSVGTSNYTGFDNRGADMSGNYIVLADAGSSRTNIWYIRTDNDDWKTNSSPWTEVRIMKPYAIEYVAYDPVQDDWVGAGRNGSVWRSGNGIDWVEAGRTGRYASDIRSQIIRQTSGKYS